uniref:SER_THR_PHOSPHATASE domain-containing protein n=1 Tax=Rhabditophanes sp. KR3021 TaxID=114890 RepID=A0AC35TY56_9BILA
MSPELGPFSIETTTLLFSLKCLYPGKVKIWRGNHESRAVNHTYGMHVECIRKYILSDLSWTDPGVTIEDYEESPRGASRISGKNALNIFLKKHNCSLFLRGHQLVQEGFRFFAERKLRINHACQ